MSLTGKRILLLSSDAASAEADLRKAHALVTSVQSVDDALAQQAGIDVLVSDLSSDDAEFAGARRLADGWRGGPRLAIAEDTTSPELLLMFDGMVMKPIASLAESVGTFLLPASAGKTVVVAASNDAQSAGEPMRLLVVDDTPVIVDVFRQIFEMLGHHVITAASGEEALKCVTEAGGGGFDVIFSDISMPGMSGHALAQRLSALRRDGSLKLKLLVAMSGYSNPEDTEKSLSSGFDRHIVKPPEMEALEKLLEEVREMRH